MNKYFSGLFSVFLRSFWKHYIAWSFIIISVYTLCYSWLIYTTHGEFVYVDTDCYTRALRIVDWMQNFEWQEKIFPYNNYPNGFVLHFTRINDIIWLIFTLPFLPFLPLKEAVFYGGFFFSPFFMILTLISVLWGIKPYIEKVKDNKLFFFLIFVFSMLFCCKLTSVFDFYRPDHHCLMGFVFSFVIAALLRSYKLKQNYKELFTAGILSGVGLWASSAPEGLYIAGTALLILTIDVIFSAKDSKNPMYYAMGFFYANLIAWLINPPLGGYGIFNNARLSVIHVALSALILASFIAFHFGNFHGKLKQISALCGFSALSAVIMLILFGTKNLFAPIYEEPVLKYFVPLITEMAPLDFILLPSVALGMIIASYMSFKLPHERCLSLLFLITAPLSMFVARFYIYYICAFAPLYAYGLITLFALKNKGDKYKSALFLYMVLPIFYFAWYEYKYERIQTVELKGVVLADTFNGPELTWIQNVDTVASPHHTNVEGIRDNRIMWFTTDENKLKELLKKREVNYITLYNVIESEYYANPDDNTDKLYGKVLTGKNTYPWMEKTDEKTYRINYDKF